MEAKQPGRGPDRRSASGLGPVLGTGALRQAIRARTRPSEPELLPDLLQQATLSPEQGACAQALALQLARGVRSRSRDPGKAGLVQGLLQEFALSSQEGVALMCLAEALLRIPDNATRDALIRDKIGDGEWEAHVGRSSSVFVNAAAWGLLLTGKLVSTHSAAGMAATLKRTLARGGEPLIRKGVDIAMRLMGQQFVTGETIAEALSHARPREAQGFRYSYDMLGEAALTRADAQRYSVAYEQAIHAIGAAAQGRGLIDGPGISIKLSALHPRYARAQAARVMAELYPRVLRLASLARQHDIGLSIDAEESERLDLSLELIERLCTDPALAGWNGIGVVIQAYQKRCPAVIDWLIELAGRSSRRLMVRLVKGAYWDAEIKRAQLDGLGGYPVYTRKVYTDVAYLACARKLLAAPEAVFPQFATHNAHTLAAVVAMAGPDYTPTQYEFQCLHGMGEPLYEQLVGGASAELPARPCRIYAPVGTHETLLAYLVRRLLENGSNTSFVNRIADPELPLETLVRDPVEQVLAEAAAAQGPVGAPHPAIVLPQALYAPARANARGVDLADERTLAALAQAFADDASRTWLAEPLLARGGAAGTWLDIRNPADHADVVGRVGEATVADVHAAVTAATLGAASWAATPAHERAARLDAAAQALEAQTLALVPLLVREAGKTCANAVAEVREAVDFLRYYAAQVRRDFDPATHLPLGPVACISPWNFPLAIFVGQVAAALAAGNVVLAKPAEQTPLVAACAVRALHAAGVPDSALQLLPGPGETVGAALVEDARIQGVLFTGSTEVARHLQRTLAGRLGAQGESVPLVAETGGQNALVVDSSALVEQAVADIVSSAFDSAGQRCSALRLLCVQEEVADRVLTMLRGAVAELALGDPRALATDIGPVIDAPALAAIERHVQAMRERGLPVWRAELDPQLAAAGTFAAPAVIEIDDIAQLGAEVFGPVLHVLRYRRERLAATLEQIRATGYGLTQGVHTRIDETIAQVLATARAGNVYVNRNIVGAVVGVQPFGGEGLSGTGPKAGGPLYLLRLLARRPPQAARLAVAASGQAEAPPVRGLHEPGPSRALQALRAWADGQGRGALAACCDRAQAESPTGAWHALPGPTGEANLYRVLPREATLCLAEDDADRLVQLAAVLAVGSRAVWPATAAPLFERLPADVREHVSLAADWRSPAVHFDAVIQHARAPALLDTAAELARRPGPLVGLVALAPGRTELPLERLVSERSLSINTAAAGGNASLMMLGPPTPARA